MAAHDKTAAQGSEQLAKLHFYYSVGTRVHFTYTGGKWTIEEGGHTEVSYGEGLVTERGCD